MDKIIVIAGFACAMAAMPMMAVSHWTDNATFRIGANVLMVILEVVAIAALLWQWMTA